MKLLSNAEQLAILSDTLAKVSEASRQDEKVYNIFAAIAKIGQPSSCRMRYAMYIEDEGVLTVKYASGNYGRINPQNISYKVSATSSLTGWVFSSKKPIRIDSLDKDVPTHPSWRGKWDSTSFSGVSHIRSFFAIPIKFEDKVIGVFSVDAEEENFFTEDIVGTLKPYISLLSLVLSSPSITDREPVIAAVSRHRQRKVLILGKDTEPEARLLKDIAINLQALNYVPILVKAQPDIPELSNEEKVRVIADLCRFVVLENSFPAGQIAECKICATNRIITATLRQRGKGSSYMVSDYFKDFDFMKEFEYTPDSNSLNETLSQAISWAESKIKERKEYYDNIYPWRKKD